jgi:hypothetical protein
LGYFMYSTSCRRAAIPHRLPGPHTMDRRRY